MNALAARDVTYSATALALIRRTVAADTTNDEFEQFVNMARALRLDPLRRQIYAFVYNKDNPKKRRMSIIVGIDGFRTIAERTGNYRPDDDEPTYEVDAAQKGPLNPAGLVKATVRVFKHSHGQWHRVTATAYWEEYAPVKDEWAENESGSRRPTGNKTLDTSGNWGRMPRLMLAKVAEALALRKAWPDDFSNVYSEEEVARSAEIELTATEIIEQSQREERQRALGGPAVLVDWCDGQPLESVPVGKFADRAMAFIGESTSGEVAAWADRNRVGLREFWAHAPGDALEIKRKVEQAQVDAAGGILAGG